MDIRDQAKAAGLPFMFKHWAGPGGDARPATLQGKTWNEFPTSVTKNMGWEAG